MIPRGVGRLSWRGTTCALAVGLATACSSPVERFLATPIPVSYQNGLLSLSGVIRPEQDSRCGHGIETTLQPPPDSTKVLLDVAAPLTVRNSLADRAAQIHPHAQLQLNATEPDGSPGALRFLKCDVPVVDSTQTFSAFRLVRIDNASGQVADSGPLGAVIGGDLLGRLALRLRLDGDARAGSGDVLFAHSDVTPGCFIDDAVVPFVPRGGDLRVQVGDALVTYPASRITVGVCVEPILDPLVAPSNGTMGGSAAPVSCLSPSRINAAVISLTRELQAEQAKVPPDDLTLQRLNSWITVAQQLQAPGCPAVPDAATLGDVTAALHLREDGYEPSGANMRLLLSTAVPDLIVSQSACLRLGDPSRCQCNDSQRVSLRLPGLHSGDAQIDAAPVADLACPLRLGGGRVAALALMAGGLHLSPCAELARSRRQRFALPKSDPSEAVENACVREGCLENLVRQSELTLRRCGYAGMQVGQACDDHQAPVAAYVEMGGSSPRAGEPDDVITALVVPDTSPILQSANIDLRNSSSQVDGVIGVSLLRRLQTVIDYPQGRIVWTCRCGALSDAGTLQRCQTYRGVTYNSADSCSSNSQLLMPVHQARTACR